MQTKNLNTEKGKSKQKILESTTKLFAQKGLTVLESEKFVKMPVSILV